MNPAQIQEILDLMGDRHMSTTDILHAMVDTDGMATTNTGAQRPASCAG